MFGKFFRSMAQPFLVASIVVMFLTISHSCATESSEIKTFLTDDRYGLASDFKTINSWFPQVEERTLPFDEGREWRQKKAVEMKSGLLSKTIAPAANDLERGLLVLALAASYFGAGGTDWICHHDFFVQAFELFAKTESEIWMKIARYVDVLGKLVETTASMNDNEEEVKDLYEFCGNESFYRQILSNEYHAIMKMLASETKTTISAENQKALRKAGRRVKLILEPQPRRH